MISQPAEPTENTINELRQILENLRTPENLENHPWVERLFVRQFLADNAGMTFQSRGHALAASVASLFRKMKPGLPPKRGKRIDTRWGEFGILAAQYFAPFVFGEPYPGSLRDACARVDSAIWLFQGEANAASPGEDASRYVLLGDESQSYPLSTVSDWHRNGITRLLGVINDYERFLGQSLPAAGETSAPSGRPASVVLSSRGRQLLKWLGWVLAVCLLACAGFLAYKAYVVYPLAMAVKDDLYQARRMVSGSLSMEMVAEAKPVLEKTRRDVESLRKEVDPFLDVFGTTLDWIPVYGQDIAAAGDLLDMSEALLDAGQILYDTAYPLYSAIETNSGDLNTEKVVAWLVQSQPEFTEANRALDLALESRAKIQADLLSPRVQELVKELDPRLELLDDALDAALVLPAALGAGAEGPQTYLLLVQNEDELRPTGGFITAVATILVQDGRIENLKFQDSGDIDKWSNPYPPAPWQLSRYMNNQVMVFRDSNWFTHYPLSAKWAESLYSYANAHSVNGVIAINQHVLVEMLSVLGPVEVPGVPYLIDDRNVVGYMRASKTATAEDRQTPGWFNKAFMNDLSSAMLDKIFSGDVPWKQFSEMTLRILDERHLLVQVDEPVLSSLVNKYGWDGAVEPVSTDFLMVVDSNIGFNKTNALVSTTITYEVNLQNLSAPQVQLSVAHTNKADPAVPCGLRKRVTIPGEKDYPMNRCYWDYMRVYTADGAQLLRGDPQTIPAEWMLTNKPVSPRVDTLDVNEEIEGLSAYGVLKVVPGGETIVTNLGYTLPTHILSIQPGTRNVVYRLLVQKQPGTVAIPFKLAVRLPADVTVQSTSPNVSMDDQVLLLETSLKTDVEFEVVFRVP